MLNECQFRTLHPHDRRSRDPITYTIHHTMNLVHILCLLLLIIASIDGALTNKVVLTDDVKLKTSTPGIGEAQAAARGRHLTRFAKFEKILLKKSQKNSAQLHPLFNLFSGFFTNTVLIHPLILPNKQMTR